MAHPPVSTGSRPAVFGPLEGEGPSEGTGTGGGAAGAGPNVVRSSLERLRHRVLGQPTRGGVHPSWTPFPRGILPPNNVRQGRRPIDALPSILLGVPSLAGHLVAQVSSSGPAQGLGQPPGDAATTTSFFTVARRGPMYFDGTPPCGDRESPPAGALRPCRVQRRDFDGKGLYSRPPAHVRRELGRQPTPSFRRCSPSANPTNQTGAAEYEESFRKELEIHQSVRYVDLRAAVFERGQTSPAHNTLFISPGTTPSPAGRWNHGTPPGRYMVCRSSSSIPAKT